jgi:hypothetical protein
MTPPAAKPYPSDLLRAIEARNKTLPYRERPTRRETMDALLECVRLAVAERDLKRRESPRGTR